MRKNFVIDTNVLLHDPQAIFHLDDSNVLIPIEVLEEIDCFKHDVSERGRNARTVAQVLDGLREHGRLAQGIALDNGGTLRVVTTEDGGALRTAGLAVAVRVAESILAVAAHSQELRQDEETVIVTKNVNLRLKADALGIRAQDYEVDRFPDPDLYAGWHSLEVEAEVLARFKGNRKVRVEGFAGRPNEYVFMTERGQPKQAACGRVTETGADIVSIPTVQEDVVGIRPLNLEQTFAMDALLNDSISLVTMTGKAGTGKTLLAVAAGLHKVFNEDRYNRILVFRPTMPVSRDIGFLPGEVAEKMRPWMQPVYDALELLRELDKRSGRKCLPPDIMECEEISVEPLTFIRGRSIPRQYIIIDEAQNLTPLEVKTVVTRVGKGTKIVLTGDPHQIDNPYVDSLSNGLTFLVDKFRASDLSAHICLVKGERSQLAETAANLL